MVGGVAMNLSNLAISILLVTIFSFVVSVVARRSNNEQLHLFVKVMRGLVLLMVAAYFLIRTSS